MSQGATFMRPGAMAWGQPGQAGHPPAEPATPVTVEHALAAAAKDPASPTRRSWTRSSGAVAAVPELRFPIDVTFPGENEPDQVDAWISAYAEPFYTRS